jgi:hypothetical protein
VIAGTVTVDGQPIWCVRIFAVAGDELLGDTATDMRGRYRIELPGDCNVMLDVEPDRLTRLLPVRRAASATAGRVVTEDFQLERGGVAEGTLEVPGSPQRLVLFAIRSEDFPPPHEDPAASAEALDAAPKVTTATAPGWFQFRGLDPAATYRLAVEGVQYAVKDAVTFRAGDLDIRAQLEIALPLALEVRDAESGAPVPRFSVEILGATYEGSMGRAVHRALSSRDSRRAGELACLRQWWTMRVEAEGYHPEEVVVATETVLLQRRREPNVLLRFEHEDGTPYEGAFSGIFGKDGARLHWRRAGSGRFSCSLPPGRWRLTLAAERDTWLQTDEDLRRALSPQSALFKARRVVDVVVPESGPAEPPPIRWPAWGSVTFDGAADFVVESVADGARAGAYRGTHQLPVGAYRVLRDDRVVLTFDVRRGETETVRVPPE